MREGATSLAPANGFGKPRRREIPGAEPVEFVPQGAAPGGGVALPPGAENADEKLSKSAAKNKKKREAKKAKEIAEKDGSAVPELAPPAAQHLSASPDRQQRPRSKSHNRNRAESNVNNTNQRANGTSSNKQPATNGKAANAAPESPTGAAANGTSQDKRVRGLLKKLRAIDELKMRLATGEKLEDTQMKKIQTEDSVRKELESLDYAG
jgi:translation initiation factor 2A